MGTGRFLAVTLLTALAAGASAFLIGAGTAHARSTTGGGVIAEAFGNQQISSSPGVYAQTTSEYSTCWSWSQLSASYDYYWYIFQSNGTLTDVSFLTPLLAAFAAGFVISLVILPFTMGAVMYAACAA